jgi:hypothetical protein
MLLDQHPVCLPHTTRPTLFQEASCSAPQPSVVAPVVHEQHQVRVIGVSVTLNLHTDSSSSRSQQESAGISRSQQDQHTLRALTLHNHHKHKPKQQQQQQQQQHEQRERPSVLLFSPLPLYHTLSVLQLLVRRPHNAGSGLQPDQTPELQACSISSSSSSTRHDDQSASHSVPLLGVSNSATNTRTHSTSPHAPRSL